MINEFVRNLERENRRNVSTATREEPLTEGGYQEREANVAGWNAERSPPG